MKNVFSIFLFAITLTLLSACEKLFIQPDPKATPTECFESMWTRIDEKYAFLEYKNINWDSVKTAFAPKFNDNMNDIQLFKTLDTMLYLLQDGHVNMYAPFNTSRNWEWYLGYPQNFNFSVLQRNYLQDNYYITGPFWNQLFKYNNKKIGYMYYGSFSSNFSDYQLSYVLSRFETTDGIIIDVRDNGGGITNNTNLLMNRFIKQKTLVGRSYDKIGKGHSDFGVAYEIYGEPSKNKKGEPLLQILDKPIVILTNRSCYSACNSFVGFMSTLPNVKIIGDQTGGGGGLPTSYQLPNGWVYRFSSSYTALPDGFNIELGVPVDIKQDMDPANEQAGKDDILERAFLEF